MKYLLLFIHLLITPLSLQAQEPVLNDFTTDGCSSYPDGYPLSDEYEWLHCCIVHDYSYWVGGTAEERYAADAEMNACIAEASGDWHGRMMELGVNIGGTAYLPTSWKWGFGWSNHKLYNSLTEEEKGLAKKKVSSIEYELMKNIGYLTDEQWSYVYEHYFDFTRQF